MTINVIVQYNGEFLPDILLLTQASIVVWFEGIIIVYQLILLLPFLYSVMYCIVFFFFGGPAC